MGAITDTLPMGANTPLSTPSGEVVVQHRETPSLDVNLTAFAVGADGRVRSDDDMIFFNQPEGPAGCARYVPPVASNGVVTHRLQFDLMRLPPGVEKVVVALTEDRGGGFREVSDLRASVATNGHELRLEPVPRFATEKGIIVAEVYRRQAQHKVRAVWQGYASGLAGLATDHGVDVEGSAQQTATPPPAPAPPPPAQSAPPSISFEKVTGSVNLKKGDKPVLMEKTPKITASVVWRTGTDYDVYALVWTKSGKQIDVATFGAKGVRPMMDYGNGAVRHLGDVQRGGGPEKTEIVEIRLNPEIIAVVPVAYSAQSNGTGSFHRYRVSLHIDNGAGTNVSISSENANDDDNIYTCVPGIIRNTADGVLIEPLELYSKRRSENRPKLYLDRGEVTIKMDAGPRNDYK